MFLTKKNKVKEEIIHGKMLTLRLIFAKGASRSVIFSSYHSKRKLYLW